MKKERTALRTLTSVKWQDRNELDEWWFDYLADSTPMGALLRKNSLVDHFNRADTHELLVLHFTPYLEDIVRTKSLYLSGGGLGACVYGVPVFSGKHPHHLADILFDFEIPGFCRRQHAPRHIHGIGVQCRVEGSQIDYPNYLAFGDVYLDVFRSAVERGEYSRVSACCQYDSLCATYSKLHSVLKAFCCGDIVSYSDTEFCAFVDSCVSQSVVFRSYYFEAVLVCAYLCQNDALALQLSERGELCNHNPKQLIFTVCSALFERFTTNRFNVSIETILKYIKECSSAGLFVIDFDVSAFLALFRLAFTKHIYGDLLGCPRELPMLLDAPHIMDSFSHLAGTILYRTADDSYFYESRFCRRYLATREPTVGTVSTYRFIPKGEIGINPVGLAREDYRVFRMNYRDSKIEIVEELDVTIKSDMAGPSNRMMRNPV